VSLSKNTSNDHEPLIKSSFESTKNNRTNKIKIINNNLNELSPIINASNSFIPIQEYYLTSQDSLTSNDIILTTKNTSNKKGSNLCKKNPTNKTKSNFINNKKNDKQLNNISNRSRRNGSDKMIESKLVYQSKQIPKLSFGNNNSNGASSSSASSISNQQQNNTQQEQIIKLADAKTPNINNNKTSNLAIPQFSANKIINNTESNIDQHTPNLSSGKY
jgi:hypothetical protein